MYRLLAIAKYEHRYVIPSGATSRAHELDSLATGCSLDTDGGPGMTAFDQIVDKFHLTDTNGAAPQAKSDRINLLNWDGKDTAGLVPGAVSAQSNGAHSHDAHAGDGTHANGHHGARVTGSNGAQTNGRSTPDDGTGRVANGSAAQRGPDGAGSRRNADDGPLEPAQLSPVASLSGDRPKGESA